MIRYKAGYKYQLVEPYAWKTRVKGFSAETEFLVLSSSGDLVIKSGYAWDGATGVPDTPHNMRGSLVHDALYQLIRMHLLPSSCKEDADLTLKDVCIDAGMSHTGAAILWLGVHELGWVGLGPERFIESAP